ncbi:MAG TPA: hypothetical protein PKH51_02365 [Candidatus Sumerlaeota bacterium]|nr:hypothetical protein [Candidatus Sumerlaeota bacterium]
MDPTSPGDGPKQLSINDVLRARQQGQQAGPAAGDPLPPPPPPQQLNYSGSALPPPPAPVDDYPPPPAPPGYQQSSGINTPPPYMQPVPPPQWNPPPLDPNMRLEDYIEAPPPEQSAMPLKSIVAAASAALGCMVGWAITIVLFHAEIGIIAILTGFNIGAAANRFGGRGMKIGFVCAGLAFAAIFFGRFFGVTWSNRGEAIEKFEVPMNNDLEFAARTLDETANTLQRSMGGGNSDALAYQKVTTHDELLEFMIVHGYTDARKPEDIPEEDITDFNENIAPALLDQLNAPKEEVQATYKAAGTGPLSVYWQHFGPYDFAYFVFGMGLAFYFGSRRDAA